MESILHEDRITIGKGGDKDIKSKSELVIFVGKDDTHPYPRIKVAKPKGGGVNFNNRREFYEIYIPTKEEISELTFAKNTYVTDYILTAKDKKEIIKFINDNIDLLWKNSDDSQAYSDTQLKIDIIDRSNSRRK